MEMLLHDFAHYVALVIEAIAIVIIAIGAIEAVIGIVRLSLRSGTTNSDRRAVWLTFARNLRPAARSLLAGGRDGPKELSRPVAALDRASFLGCPVAHVVHVRNDACPRLEILP